MQSGLGPAGFDCSGLVVRSVCDVMGTSPDAWPLEHRHVRDIWYDAQAGRLGQATFELAEGSLVVQRRRYDFDDQEYLIAGHIGIITNVNAISVSYIHANPKRGVVEELPLKSFKQTMGAVRINW